MCHPQIQAAPNSGAAGFASGRARVRRRRVEANSRRDRRREPETRASEKREIGERMVPTLVVPNSAEPSSVSVWWPVWKWKEKRSPKVLEYTVMWNSVLPA